MIDVSLSNFATSSDPSVDEEVARVISEFHAEKKPMAFCCIAPVLVALVLGKGGTKVTLVKDFKLVTNTYRAFPRTHSR